MLTTRPRWLVSDKFCFISVTASSADNAEELKKRLQEQQKQKKKNHYRKTSLPSHLDLDGEQAGASSSSRHRHTDPGLSLPLRHVAQDSGITEEGEVSPDGPYLAPLPALPRSKSSGDASPLCRAGSSSPPRTNSGSSADQAPAVDGKSGTGDSSDSGTSMSLMSNGDNSGGSIPSVGASGDGPHPMIKSGSGEIAELLSHMDQDHTPTSQSRNSLEDELAGFAGAMVRQNGAGSRYSCAVTGVDSHQSGSREGTADRTVMRSLSDGQAVGLHGDIHDGLLRSDTPDPPSLPPRTYRIQPAPPLPPRHHRQDKDAPPLPPRNNTDKTHRKRPLQTAEPAVPPERSQSLELPPPPLPPRTYSPIHMSPQDGERSGGSSAEGFAVSDSPNHHHFHDSPSTSNDSGNTSREDDPSMSSWRPVVAGHHPQSRHSVAEVERTGRTRDPLSAHNLGLTNQARDRNSLPVMANNTGNLHAVDATGSGGIVPPHPHPKLTRMGAVERRPLVSSISEQSGQSAEVFRSKGRGVDGLVSPHSPEPGSTASIPPRLQPRSRNMSEEEQRQHWQQINQHLHDWTRRNIRSDSPHNNGAPGGPHVCSEDRRVPCFECDNERILDGAGLGSPGASQAVGGPGGPPSHSPPLPEDRGDGREGRSRNSVASNSSGHTHGPLPPIPAAARQPQPPPPPTSQSQQRNNDSQSRGTDGKCLRTSLCICSTFTDFGENVIIVVIIHHHVSSCCFVGTINCNTTHSISSSLHRLASILLLFSKTVFYSTEMHFESGLNILTSVRLF
jgi:hypothetical protein